jgi:hypothetical protein
MKKSAFYLALFLPTLATKAICADFSTQSMHSQAMSHPALSPHVHESFTAPTPNSQPVVALNSNPRGWSGNQSAEIKYWNANYHSRCLGVEHNRNSKVGTTNNRLSNMRLKFEKPESKNLNFNAN